MGALRECGGGWSCCKVFRLLDEKCVCLEEGQLDLKATSVEEMINVRSCKVMTRLCNDLQVFDISQVLTNSN